jgi:hypothetical protein
MDDYAYTSGQIARLLGIPPRTARRYIASGRIQARQDPITHRWVVPAAALLRFLAACGLDGNATEGRKP